MAIPPYWLTVICNVPLPPPDVAVAVIVTVPVVPPSVAEGAVVFVPLTVMIEELFELQLALTLELRLTIDPVPPFVVKLILFPEQLAHVIVTD
jgi:hypothetical protein